MSKTGLQALLIPKDSVLLLTDHQPFVMNTQAKSVRRLKITNKAGWVRLTLE